MATKGSCLLGQENSRETSKPHRCLVHCCTVIHLASPTCSWLASWRSPSKIWALGIHLEYRFSIWHFSIRCEVFLNQFPEKKLEKIQAEMYLPFHCSECSSGFGWHTSTIQGPSLLMWPCCLVSACVFIQ